MKTKFKVGDVVKDRTGSSGIVSRIEEWDGFVWYEVAFAHGVRSCSGSDMESGDDQPADRP